MITPEYVNTMARYNAWQNQSLINAASLLSAAERDQERGAFFGSIQQTFSHVLWGDMVWMHRFADTPLPKAGSISESREMCQDWGMFVQQRADFDNEILQWAACVTSKFLSGKLSWYSGAIGAQITKPISGLVVHMFNHQTHHRGQIHAMLTSEDLETDDTDLFVVL